MEENTWATYQFGIFISFSIWLGRRSKLGSVWNVLAFLVLVLGYHTGTLVGRLLTAPSLKFHFLEGPSVLGPAVMVVAFVFSYLLTKYKGQA